ncbi:hypothetical protein K7432_000261 [Basidiobolus ranarum]|uniref:Serpin domain-containing protein n=1 Tax=Basidiobolus ranarum TaxID=34480 RepID=A0ABR2X523_9FUNG
MVFNATVGALVSSVGVNLASSLQESVSPTTNILFSPLSIFSALFMLLYGTAEKSQSRSELLQFFGTSSSHGNILPQLAGTFHDFFQPLMGDHESNKALDSSNATFLLENSLWGKSFKPSYIDLAKMKFFASVFPQLPTAEKVNSWVARNTKNHITKILPPKFSLNPRSLLLVNTVFFHGKWKNEFKSSLTREEEFRVLNGKPIKTKMMNSFKAKWGYDETENYQVLDMPYTDDRFVATVVLPRNIQSFADFSNNLSKEDWTSIFSGNRYRRQVNLSLPKFDLEQALMLNQALKKAGVGKIFDSDAKLTNLSKSPFYVSDVLHKCRIEVDEKGSKASAATGIFMAYAAVRMPERTPEMRCDRPFLFVIRTKTGVPMFIAYISKPKSL